MSTPAWLIRGPIPPEFETDERCAITEILNSPENPSASLALARVAPGVTTRLHALEATVEVYILLAGRGIAEIGGARAEVGPGDRVVIPAGVAQRITAAGGEELRFYCLCTPRFRPDAYRDLEPDADAESA